MFLSCLAEAAVLMSLFYSVFDGAHIHLASAEYKTGSVRLNVNMQACSRNSCCSGKAISILYSECVSVALVIRHAKRIRRMILSSILIMMMVWIIKHFRLLLVRLYSIFQQYLINGTIFREKVIEHKKCALILSATSVSNSSHSEKNWAR